MADSPGVYRTAANPVLPLMLLLISPVSTDSFAFSLLSFVLYVVVFFLLFPPFCDYILLPPVVDLILYLSMSS